MTALEYFRLFAPEFSTVPDVTVNPWIAIAETLTVTDCLDIERASMAKALYAAHLLSLSTRSGSGGSSSSGAITREKEGDLERTYGEVKGSNTYLGQTTYGQQYLDITRVCAGSAIMTRVNPIVLG